MSYSSIEAFIFSFYQQLSCGDFSGFFDSDSNWFQCQKVAKNNVYIYILYISRIKYGFSCRYVMIEVIVFPWGLKIWLFLNHLFRKKNSAILLTLHENASFLSPSAIFLKAVSASWKCSILTYTTDMHCFPVLQNSPVSF